MGLPSSFDCPLEAGEEESFAKVTYELKATLELQQSNQVAVSYSTLMTVNQAIDYTEGGIRQEISEPVYLCFCFNQGSIEISTYFENDRYKPGDTPVLVVNVDNSESKIGVESIDVQLRQETTIKTLVFSHKINRELSKFSFSGFKAGCAKIGDDALKLHIPLKSPEGKSILPSKLLSTCKSKRISNRYVVVLTVRMEGCQLAFKQPKTELFLNIAEHSKANETWNLQPIPFNPQVMKPISIQFLKGSSMEDKSSEYSPKDFSSRGDKDVRCPVLHEFRN